MAIKYVIYVCADCPCCEEGAVEGDFYCKHEGAPEDDRKDRLAIHDGIPAWCPIRAGGMLIRVG